MGAKLHKILQFFCGLRGHSWYVTESCGRKVWYCRKCGKMAHALPKGSGDTAKTEK